MTLLLNKKTSQYMTYKPVYFIFIYTNINNPIYSLSNTLYLTTQEEVYEYLKANNFDVENNLKKS